MEVLKQNKFLIQIRILQGFSTNFTRIFYYGNRNVG